MSTRSITILRDGNSNSEIAVLYRHHDGYPSGHGADIAKALGGKQVSHGIREDSVINGAGDMAVQLIAWLKQDSTVNAPYRPRAINSAGGLYLWPPGTRNCGEEYTYTITCTSPGNDRTGGIAITCTGYDARDSFDGDMDGFVKWIEAAPWATEDDEDA